MDKLGRAVKNLFGSLKRSVQPKEMVGADELGNKYFRWVGWTQPPASPWANSAAVRTPNCPARRWQGILDGRAVERRQVKVAGYAACTGR